MFCRINDEMRSRTKNAKMNFDWCDSHACARRAMERVWSTDIVRWNIMVFLDLRFQHGYWRRNVKLLGSEELFFWLTLLERYWAFQKEEMESRSVGVVRW